MIAEFFRRTAVMAEAGTLPPQVLAAIEIDAKTPGATDQQKEAIYSAFVMANKHKWKNPNVDLGLITFPANILKPELGTKTTTVFKIYCSLFAYRSDMPEFADVTDIDLCLEEISLGSIENRDWATACTMTLSTTDDLARFTIAHLAIIAFEYVLRLYLN